MNEGETFEFEMDGLLHTARIIKVLGVKPFKFEIEIIKHEDLND